MLGVLTPHKQNSPISFCDIYFFSFTIMYCHFNKKNEQQQHLFVLFFLHLNIHMCIPCHLIRLHPPWLFRYSKPKISVCL